MDDRPSIRKADSNDIEGMVGLLAELFSIEDDFTIDSKKQRCGLELILKNSAAVILVAEKEDQVIGMISMQSLISTAMGERSGLIEDMIVTAEYRLQGIGRLLLGAIIEESLRLGYARLSLGVDLRNHPAQAFYHTFGFEMSSMGLMYRKR